MVTLHTNFGDIKIKLFTEKAPITCENFYLIVKKLTITLSFTE